MVLAVAPPKLLQTWEPALRARGFEVIRAAGRADALSELRRSNVAAVVVSERLPWNAALRITRAVKSDSGLAGVPVVVAGFPEITTAQRLRLRGSAPDATVPMKATPEEVAAAVSGAAERGPLPALELTPAQERAARLQRAATILMLAGVVLSLPTRGLSSGAQIWFILLVPAGGLVADWANGRLDGRRAWLSWQGWAAIVLGFAMAAAIVLFPWFFGRMPLPGR
jgi:ActR/RegA family two-component response regulator